MARPSTADSPGRSTGRRFLSARFIAAAVVLVAAIIGLNAATAQLKELFLKAPLPIRKPLEQFDGTRLPSFTRLPDEDSLFTSVGGDVGTEEVIARTYELKGAESLSLAERSVMLFITYYDDPEYLVSHTPEVCYRQAGSVISSMDTIDLQTPEMGPGYRGIKARVLDIEQGEGRLALLYTLCCNGDFFYDREQVRLRLGLPGDDYIYIAKVEAVTVVPGDTDFEDAVNRVKLMLREALPVLMEEHFPSREAARGE